MTRKPQDDASKRRHAYEHVLRSIRSADDILRECYQDIRDIDLDAGRNTRDLDRIAWWAHQTSAEIYKLYPDLAPPDREPPPRRWPRDPGRIASVPDLTREQALYRVRHNLELVQLILSESQPFARQLNLTGDELDEQLGKINEIHKAVVQELWKDLSDEKKRNWVRFSGMPVDVAEPPQPDRHKALGRLSEKLETAVKVLADCAELVVELELEPQIHLKSHIRSIGECLAVMTEIQMQIYKERPDLIPEFLKDTDRLRHLNAKGPKQ